MATDLATGTLSGELIDAEGYYFRDEDVGSATALLSDALLDGKRQGRIEIVGIAKTEIVVAATMAFKIELQSAVYGGAYTTFDIPEDVTGAVTIPVGTEIFRVAIPSDADESIKVKVTSDATNTGTLDVYDVYRV